MAIAEKFCRDKNIPFKSGEYINNALKFGENNKVGDMIAVHFNFNKNEYNKKDGSGKGVFYKNAAWKVEKVSAGANSVDGTEFPQPNVKMEIEEPDDTTGTLDKMAQRAAKARD